MGANAMQVDVPRFIISAPSSGCGKTTVAAGLMAAFAQDHHVQGFKVGPDFIDPGYHSAASGRASRNLDSWMLSPAQVRETFARASQNADLAIIEGVMGLFDGYDATESGSTAEIAKLLYAPVILVIDASRLSRSAGAIALGCRDFDRDLDVAGVICNQVGGATHAAWVTQAVESIGLPVLGCLPWSESLQVPERYLGLHTAVEREKQTQAFLENAAELIRQHLDLETLQAIAASAPTFEAAVSNMESLPQRARIAVAKDEAFSFYYEDNLDALRAAGAEIVFFSPLHDAALPENSSGLYLGGGYPELYAEQLSSNIPLLRSVRQALKATMPLYAECGGLMYLTQMIVDSGGKRYGMVGALPGCVQIQPRLTIGYREVVAHRDTLLLRRGEAARGHEFHRSAWMDRPADLPEAYIVADRLSSMNSLQGMEGVALNNLLASYIHLHFDSHPSIASNFVNACVQWQERV
jgi:cobyrinic acid a,c-diamide synthase